MPGKTGFAAPGAYTPAVRLDDWIFKGACAGESDLFFHDGHPYKHADATALAKRICSRCPVIDECADYCDEIEKYQPPNLWFGIWAGETPQERAIRRRR